MTTDNLAKIREFFRKAEVPLDHDDVWAVQGTPVVKHKALERLQRALKIKFSAPTVLRHERDEAVVLATGTLGDETEWSIGEACVNVNYRVSGKMAAYPYAMAEKRAKDRVILKLANLAGVYSEDEADDFRQSNEATPYQERERGSITITSGKPAPSMEGLRKLLADLGRTEASLVSWAAHKDAQIKKLEDFSPAQLSEVEGILLDAKHKRDTAKGNGVAA